MMDAANNLELKLCDIQGRLFERSLKKKLDSAAFMRQFMYSHTAAALDSSYNRMQWAGEEYLLEELEAECGAKLKTGGVLFDNEQLYWAGYLYRYWHFMTGESSKEIYKQANAQTMRRNYLMFHTMDNRLAVENLKEIHRQCARPSAAEKGIAADVLRKAIHEERLSETETEALRKTIRLLVGKKR